MTRLTMLEQPRPDGLDGHIQADLRPSSDDGAIVTIDINNHFSISEPEKTIGCADAMDILTSQWQSAMDYAEFIADGLMETVEGLK